MSAFQAGEYQLYFVYGANMNPAQMADRCGKPEVVAVARLAGYRFMFFGHSGIWDSGEETVVRQPGDEVWGVVYKLSFAQADSLDTWQGVRLDGSGVYFPYPSHVLDAKGVGYPVTLYKKDSCGEPQKPSEEYLAHIVAGAVAQGLPADYIERLKRTAAKKAGYPVPRQEGRTCRIFASGCQGCG